MRRIRSYSIRSAILLCLLFATPELHAQKVKAKLEGIIRDYEDKTPIDGIIVNLCRVTKPYNLLIVPPTGPFLCLLQRTQTHCLYVLHQ